MPQQSAWQPRWPDAEELRTAAGAAAKNPRTWAPLAGAAVLSATGLDDDVSDWIADDRPLFGSGAGKASDRLRDLAVASYLATALVVPSDSAADKLSGLGQGVVTLYGQGALVEGLKEATSRRRPNNANRRSFPSGHTSTASAAAAMATRNLAAIDMPARARTALTLGFDAMAVGTGWARIEARKHFAADVLAGYAVGNFVAAFAQGAFIEHQLPGARIAFQPIPAGGALRLTVPLAGTR